MSEKYTEILNFWFGSDFTHGMPSHNRNALWFEAKQETDQIISARFSNDIQAAALGRYDDWCSQAEARLALIILLDQFPRNIYRGTAQAFSYDEQASELCLEGLKLSQDQQLIPAYRSFFYMPLEHSESLPHQQRCVKLFHTLYRSAAPAIAEAIKSNLAFAQQHLEIIEKFGRFPHRNAVLNRPSTPQELAFLEKTGLNFGQG